MSYDGIKNKIDEEEVRKMKAMFKILRDQEGATAPEYGLMVALIAVVILGAVKVLGTSLEAVFNNIATTIGGA